MTTFLRAVEVWSLFSPRESILVNIHPPKTEYKGRTRISLFFSAVPPHVFCFFSDIPASTLINGFSLRGHCLIICIHCGVGGGVQVISWDPTGAKILLTLAYKRYHSLHLEIIVELKQIIFIL